MSRRDIPRVHVRELSIDQLPSLPAFREVLEEGSCVETDETDLDLAALAEGKLSEAGKQRLAQHLTGCIDCFNLAIDSVGASAIEAIMTPKT